MPKMQLRLKFNAKNATFIGIQCQKCNFYNFHSQNCNFHIEIQCQKCNFYNFHTQNSNFHIEISTFTLKLNAKNANPYLSAKFNGLLNNIVARATGAIPVFIWKRYHCSRCCSTTRRSCMATTWWLDGDELQPSPNDVVWWSTQRMSPRYRRLSQRLQALYILPTWAVHCLESAA